MPARRFVSAVAVSLAAIAAPVAPVGAATWSAPQGITGSEGRYPLLAKLTATGPADAFLTGPLALIPLTEPQVPVSLSTRSTGTAFGPPVGLGAYAEPVAISPSGKQVIAVAGPRGPEDYFSLENNTAVHLRVVISEPGSTLRRVATGSALATRTLDAAVNDAGDAAVMYARCRDRYCANTSVWAIFRRRGGKFSTPVPLAGRTYRAAGSVVMNPAGDALMAWEESRGRANGGGEEIRTRMRTIAGHLTPLRRAGPTNIRPEIALTLTKHRTGTIAWFSEAVSLGSNGGPVTVSANRLSAGGRIGARVALDRFSPPAGDGTAVSGARLRAILDPDDRTTLAWTGHDTRYLVRVVRFPGHAEPQTLSPGGQNAELQDLAGDSAGDAIVIWTGGGEPAALAGTPVPGVGIALRTTTSQPFALPDMPLVNTSARVYRTAAASIASAQRILIAAGVEKVLNQGNPPGVYTTERTG